MKKLRPILAALLLAALCLALPLCARAESPRKLTVMVYMCGSNLESGYGSASADLEEMLASGFDSDQVSLLVMTGGTEGWVLGFDPANLTINEIGKRGVRAVWREEAASMGVPETLTTLLNFGVERFPAEDYALILWNHGGGPMEGVCWDELFSMDNLSLSELTQALEASTLPGKLSWIGFDACLMSSAEVASTLAPYADYMIASQETEPAPGWNYTFLKGLESDADAAETGKRIVDAYFDGMAGIRDTVTLACTDLSKLEGVKEAMDAFFEPVAEGLDADSFARVSGLRQAAVGFGKAVRAAGEDGYDLVDLGDLVREYGEDPVLSDAAQAFSEALDEAVVYCRSSAEGASGLTVYHPYANKAKYAERWGADYQGIDFSEGYRNYLNRFGALLTGEVMADWSGLEAAGDQLTEDEENLFTLQLTPAQVSTFASAQLLVLGAPETNSEQFSAYLVNYDDHPLVSLYAQPAQLDENGLLTAAYSGRTLYVTGADGEPQIGPISFNMADDGSFYTTLAWYEDASGRENAMPQATVRFDFLLDEDGQPVVTGTRVQDEATGSFTNRIPIDESRYTRLEFQHIMRLQPEADGTLPAFRDWPLYKALYTQYITLPQDWQLRFFDEQLTNQQLYGTFQVTDIQQNTFSSPLTPLKNPNVTPISVAIEPSEIGGCRLSAEAMLSDAPIGSGLVLNLTAENPTGDRIDFDIDKLVLNGTRLTNEAWNVSWLDPGEKTTRTLRIGKVDLFGLSRIDEISCDIQWGRSDVWDKVFGEPEGTATLRLRPEDCDVSGVAWNTGVMAEAEDGDATLRLVDLGYKRYLDYDFDGWLWITNDGNEPYSHRDNYVLFNGLRGDDSLFLNLPPLPPHMDRLVRFGYANRNTLGSYDVEVAGGATHRILGVERLLQRAGMDAVSEVSLLLDVSLSTGEMCRADLVLDAPWPLPEAALQPAEGDEASGILLLDGPVSVTLENTLVGLDGVGLGLTLRNDTDESVVLVLLDPTVNGAKAAFGSYASRSFFLAPRSSFAQCLPISYSEASEITALERFGMTFRQGSVDTRPMEVVAPEPIPVNRERGTRLSGDAFASEPAVFEEAELYLVDEIALPEPGTVHPVEILLDLPPERVEHLFSISVAFVGPREILDGNPAVNAAAAVAVNANPDGTASVRYSGLALTAGGVPITVTEYESGENAWTLECGREVRFLEGDALPEDPYEAGGRWLYMYVDTSNKDGAVRADIRSRYVEGGTEDTPNLPIGTFDLATAEQRLYYYPRIIDDIRTLSPDVSRLLPLPADEPLQFALVPVETLGDDLVVCGTLYFDDAPGIDFEMDYPGQGAQ